MHRGLRGIAPLVVLILVAVSLGSPAVAAVKPQTAQFEVLFGYYLPGPEVLDDSTFFGLRAGYNAGTHLYFDLELAFQDSNTSFFDEDASADVNVDYEAFLLDLSAGWTFLTRKRASPVIYGGFGWVNVTADVETRSQGFDDSIGGVAKNTATANLGAGVRISVTRGSYLRADYRLRWFNERDDDAVDAEATLAYGWYF